MNRSHIKWIGVIAAVLLAVTIYAWNLVAKPGAPTFSASPIPTATEQKPSPSIQPNITWSPTSVVVTLSPGETTSRTITFTSSLLLRNVHIKLKTDKERKDDVTVEPDSSLKERDDGKDKPKSTSSVKSFLKIEPDRFANVSADRPQTVRLSFAIPAHTALGTYEGVIALRSNVDESDKDDSDDDENDGKTLSQLKVVVNVWQSFRESGFGFAFRYPPTWVALISPVVTDGRRIELYTAKSAASSDLVVPAEIVLVTLAKPPSQPLDTFSRTYGGGTFTNYKISTIQVINGQLVVAFDDSSDQVGSIPEIAAFVSLSDDKVVLVLSSATYRQELMTIIESIN